jgi:hypothetical protein
MELARQENKLNPKKRQELSKNTHQVTKPARLTWLDPKKG